MGKVLILGSDCTGPGPHSPAQPLLQSPSPVSFRKGPGLDLGTYLRTKVQGSCVPDVRTRPRSKQKLSRALELSPGHLLSYWLTRGREKALSAHISEKSAGRWAADSQLCLSVLGTPS